VLKLVRRSAEAGPPGLVATGSGYWRLTAPGIRWRAPVLWHVIVPVATRLWGYHRAAGSG
jgi:hypothetical protein